MKQLRKVQEHHQTHRPVLAAVANISLDAVDLHCWNKEEVIIGRIHPMHRLNRSRSEGIDYRDVHQCFCFPRHDFNQKCCELQWADGGDAMQGLQGFFSSWA